MGTPEGKPNFDLRTAAALRRMGALGAPVAFFILASVLLAPPLAAVLVLLWVWLSRTPLGDIGLKRPGSWIGAIVVGVILGAGLKLAMKAVVMPVFGAPAAAAILQNLRGDLNAFLIEVPQMIVLAGFAEEIVFRGFLINRLQVVLGSGVVAGLSIVVLSAAIFGPLHYVAQGWFGALQATVVGVVFASVYLLNGRRLWSLMIAHAAFDVAAIYLSFAGREERVAHAVFP